MTIRKGIILAGGSGTRLYPVTIGVSKQLLPVYDKPMIYYPISTLMLTKIRQILIITTPQDKEQFKRVIGDGSQWGIQISYKTQSSPDGIAQAFTLSEQFLNKESSVLILGDNIFFGQGLPKLLLSSNNMKSGATVFTYHVSEPKHYGVIGFDEDGRPNLIIEKPKKHISNYAITGLYFVDGTAPDRVKKIKPSPRGELEITSLLESYLEEGQLSVEKMGRGYSWLDTGTYNSLIDAGNYVRTLTERQGLQIGSPDEIAYNLGWISDSEILSRAEKFNKIPYGDFLFKLIKGK